MPSQLPTTDTLNRKVNTFGYGTYDGAIESEYKDEGDFEARGESLPSQKEYKSRMHDPDAPDRGDVYSPVSDAGRCSSSALPGDSDRPVRYKKKPEDSIIQPVIKSVAEAKLPYDESNPPARSDYYDKTKIGETALPGPSKNEETLDKLIGAYGNAWSNWELDDVAQPMSFPVMDNSLEEIDKYTSVPIGASARERFTARGLNMKKTATNLELIGTLTSDFLKKVGKSGVTRRHVMAFLQENGYHQYLASDIIRCLQHRHGVHVADVLDQFPVSTKTASTDFHTLSLEKLTQIRKQIASIMTSSQSAHDVLKKCGDRVDSVVEMVRGLQDG
jgi:hypothetical protein